MNGRFVKRIKQQRANGLAPHEIAETIGYPLETVLWVLDENGERAAKRAERLRARLRSANEQSGQDILNQPYRKRVPQQDRPVNLTRQERINALARELSEGRINRTEFNHRLRQAYAEGAAA